MTNEELTELARGMGKLDGYAAGSWVIDGNTTKETAQKIWDGYNDGDPETMDMMPAPLSGEFAGDRTPSTLAEELRVSSEDDMVGDLCTAYEEGYHDGYWDEVVRSICAQFGVMSMQKEGS